MIQRWHCPECKENGEVTVIAHPQIGDVLCTITEVSLAHRKKSPECPVTKRPAGYVKIILFMEEEKEKVTP